MKLTIEHLNNLIRNQVKAALQEKRKVSLKTLFEELTEQKEEEEKLEEEAGLDEQAPMPPAPPMPGMAPMAPAPMPPAPMPPAPGMMPDPFAMPPMPPAPMPGMPPAPPMPGMAPMGAMPGIPPAPIPAPMPGAAPAAAVPPPPMMEIYSRGQLFETSRWQKLAGILNEKEEWMQKAGEEMEKKGTKGALHRQLGKEKDEKISKRELESIKKRLQKKAEGDKKLSAEDRKLLRRVVFALNAMKAD